MSEEGQCPVCWDALPPDPVVDAYGDRYCSALCFDASGQPSLIHMVDWSSPTTVMCTTDGGRTAHQHEISQPEKPITIDGERVWARNMNLCGQRVLVVWGPGAPDELT